MDSEKDIELKRMVNESYSELSTIGHEAARTKFDQAVKYALKHDLPVNTGWSRLSSYPSYRVITLEDPNIAYFPSTKCGSTTVKRWLMEINHTRRKHQGMRQAISVPRSPHSYWGYKADFDLSKYSEHEMIAVIRDPLVRFFSFFFDYRDRILSGAIEKNTSLACHISDIDDFIESFCSSPIFDMHIFQHTLPQTKFFCSALDQSLRLFQLEKLDELRGYLENTFEMAIPELVENRSSRKKPKISAKSIDSIINYYQNDYKMLADYYSPEDSIMKFEEGV